MNRSLPHQRDLDHIYFFQILTKGKKDRQKKDSGKEKNSLALEDFIGNLGKEGKEKGGGRGCNA